MKGWYWGWEGTDLPQNTTNPIDVWADIIRVFGAKNGDRAQCDAIWLEGKRIMLHNIDDYGDGMVWWMEERDA